MYCRCPSKKEILLRSVKPLSRPKKLAENNEFDPACASYKSDVPKHLPVPPIKPQVGFH